MDYGRQVDVQTAPKDATVRTLNYMLLTVVANGQNCVATATAGYAQGCCQDFTLVATEAECQSIFSQKKLTTFLVVVCKTLLY